MDCGWSQLPEGGALGSDEEELTDRRRCQTERVEELWGKWEESVRKWEVSGCMG